MKNSIFFFEENLNAVEYHCTNTHTLLHTHNPHPLSFAGLQPPLECQLNLKAVKLTPPNLATTHSIYRRKDFEDTQTHIQVM